MLKKTLSTKLDHAATRVRQLREYMESEPARLGTDQKYRDVYASVCSAFTWIESARRKLECVK